MFNLPANEQFSRTGEDPTSGILTKMFIGLQNTMGPATWQKRFLWYIASAGDRQGFNQSARKIASWDFEKIIPCRESCFSTHHSLCHHTSGSETLSAFRDMSSDSRTIRKEITDSEIIQTAM